MTVFHCEIKGRSHVGGRLDGTRATLAIKLPETRRMLSVSALTWHNDLWRQVFHTDKTNNEFERTAIRALAALLSV